jgi:excisionase family DNA binding protein
MSSRWEARMAALDAPTRLPTVAASTPPPPEPVPYVFSRAETAQYLGVSLNTINRLIAEGILPTFHLGTRHLIRRADAEALVDQLAQGHGHFALPESVAQYRSAAHAFASEAEATRRMALSATHPQLALRRHHAADAFAALADWYAWLSGDWMEREESGDDAA